MSFAPGQVVFWDRLFEDEFLPNCQKANIFSFAESHKECFRLSLPALQFLGRCNSLTSGPKMAVGRHKQGNIVRKLDERRTKFWSGWTGMLTAGLDV